MDRIIKNKIIIYGLLIILMLGLVISVCHKQMQNDVYWSIKVGEKLVKEGIWEIDDFSVHSGLKYVAHHFFTDIVIYLTYLVGSFRALYILEIILVIITAICFYFLNKQICKNKLLSYFFVVIQLILFHAFIAVRAQMFSYILFILELILLEKSRSENKKWQYILLGVIPIILANFHMGVVPFYFIILGVYIIDTIKVKVLWLKLNTKPDKTRLKKLLIIFLIGIITIFINPYGLDGVVYPFKTLGNEFINSYISEFQPFSLSSAWSVYILIYIFITIIVFMCNKEKTELKDVLLVLGTLFMTFLAFRYVGFYIICSSVMLKYIINIFKELNITREDKLALAGVGVLLIMIFTYYFFDNKTHEYVSENLAPRKAIQFIKENIKEDMVIYNEYEWGGYLMLENIPVFIDSRCDLYTIEYNDSHDIATDYIDLNMGKSNFREIIQKYGINVFLIKKGSVISTLLNEMEEYINVYEDEIATIYIKK